MMTGLVRLRIGEPTGLKMIGGWIGEPTGLKMTDGGIGDTSRLVGRQGAEGELVGTLVPIKGS